MSARVGYSGIVAGMVHARSDGGVRLGPYDNARRGGLTALIRLDRLSAAAACLLLVCAAASYRPEPPLTDAVFFDDFSEADQAGLAGNGWIVRAKPGHPGIDGAWWGPGAVALITVPQRPGNRLLRLSG